MTLAIRHQNPLSQVVSIPNSIDTPDKTPFVKCIGILTAILVLVQQAFFGDVSVAPRTLIERPPSSHLSLLSPPQWIQSPLLLLRLSRKYTSLQTLLRLMDVANFALLGLHFVVHFLSILRQILPQPLPIMEIMVDLTVLPTLVVATIRCTHLEILRTTRSTVTVVVIVVGVTSFLRFARSSPKSRQYPSTLNIFYLPLTFLFPRPLGMIPTL